MLWLYRGTIITLTLIVVSLLVWQYLRSSYEPIEMELFAKINTELEFITSIAGGDDVNLPVVATPYRSITSECTNSEQREYEAVLQRLGTGLANDELIYLASWFDRCGMLVSQRAILTEAAIASTLKIVEHYQEIYETIPTALRRTPPFSHQQRELLAEYQSAWQSYAASQRALDELQRDLIEARLNNEPVDGERIENLLQAVTEQRKQLAKDSEQKRILAENITL